MSETTPQLRTTSGAVRRKKMFAVVPTLLTLGNATCGFGSITYAAKVGPDTLVTNELYLAALLIFIAMVFDALDGPIARLSKQASDFGAQLDSLCDAISFGAAPAFLMLRASLGHPIHQRILWVIAVLYMLCAILRLAKFNVLKDTDHEYFSGLPSPAAAGMVASLVVISPELHQLTSGESFDWKRSLAVWLTQFTSVALPIVTLCVACLMVSRIRYPHLFNQLFRGRRSFQHLVKLIFAIVAAFAVHELAVPLIFCYFVVASPITALWNQAARRLRGAPPIVPPSERPAA